MTARPAAVAPAARVVPPARGLFAPPPSAAPSESPPAAIPPAPRNSLFGIVTGAIRRTMPSAAPSGEAARAEPQLPPAVEAPSVRPASPEEIGLDIPAFLRRQSS